MTPDATEKAKILCVDDDPDALTSYAAILRLRYDVHLASNGADALKVLEEKGPFAVVVSDLNMPNMNGVVLLSRARYAAPDTVRVLLTGQADLELAAEAVNKGAISGFLFKPCPAETLLRTAEDGVSQFRLATVDAARWRELVFRDDLTRLYNRRYFDLALAQEHARSDRHQRPYAVAFIDLDGLKAVNTQYGHLAGSMVIEQAGTIIGDLLRSADLGFRYGGDEFVIVLPETSRAEGMLFAEKILGGIRAHPFEADGARFVITASIGIACFPSDGDSARAILKAADAAMFAAKDRGKNTLVCYDATAIRGAP